MPQPELKETTLRLSVATLIQIVAAVVTVAVAWAAARAEVSSLRAEVGGKLDVTRFVQDSAQNATNTRDILRRLDEINAGVTTIRVYLCRGQSSLGCSGK